MPDELKQALATEVANPNKNNNVIVEMEAIAGEVDRRRGWDRASNKMDQIRSDFIDSGNTGHLPFVINPETGIVKVDVRCLTGQYNDSEFINHFQEASAWCFNITVNGNNGTTVYLTNVIGYGNANASMINDVRPISGEKLAY